VQRIKGKTREAIAYGNKPVGDVLQDVKNHFTASNAPAPKGPLTSPQITELRDLVSTHLGNLGNPPHTPTAPTPLTAKTPPR